MQGRLGYQQIVGKVGSWIETCGAEGSALPALTPESGTKPTRVAVAFVKTSFPSRDDAIKDCANATPAPVVLRWMSGTDGNAPALDVAEVTLAETSLSMRPPALVPSALIGGVLAGVPDADEVRVSAVTTVNNIAGSATSKGLAGARAVALATRSEGSVEHFAIAAELGCTPQAISVAFGKVSNAGAAVVFEKIVDVSKSGTGIQVQPSIAWTDARGGEWLASWISDGPRAVLQRISKDGELIGGPVTLIDGATAAVVASSGDHAFAIVEQPSRQFKRVELSCFDGGN